MDTVYANSKDKWLSPENLVWIIAVIGVLLFQALPGPRPLDDAYITFRYARNISSGAGFVYNPGEFVQGTTTALYTLLLTLFSLVFGSASLPVVSFAIALLADVINVWLLFRIAQNLLKHDLAALILAIVFLLQPLRLNVAIGGMETSLFITLLLLMYDSYLVRQKTYLAAIFGSLAILTRPDAILAVGPVFLHVFWKNRAVALKAALLGAIILAPWYAWATWYFGNPIPFSIIAKLSVYLNYSPSETFLLLLTFLGTGTVGPYKQLMIIFPGLVITLFLIIPGVFWLRKGNQKSLVVISYPFLFFLVMTVQHAPVFFSWYYLPLMPGMLLLFFGALLHLFSPELLKGRRYRPQILFGLLGFALLIVPAVLMKLLPGWADSRQVEMSYQQASASVHDQITNKLVYAPDIGVIGWRLENARVLDPIGLVSPVSINYLDTFRETDTASCEMVRDLKPDFVIAREEFIVYLLKDPDFQEDYQLIWQQSIAYNNDEKVVIFKRN